MTKSILGYSKKALEEILSSLNQPKFRAKQIHQWIYSKFSADFSAMKNIPKKLIESLEENYSVNPFSLEHCLKASDGTEKFVLRCQDGKLIETVYIPSEKRRTVCISTQVGCPVNCVFCASGKAGLIRNLSAAEIAGQILFIANRYGKMPTNIVVMGMGEPLLNPHTIEGLKIVTSEEFFNLGARHVTVSTSGIVPGIKKLADEQIQWNLAVSIHAPSDELRRNIIPDKCRYPLTEIIDACKYYLQKTGRKITFEYTLVKGENDSYDNAVNLAKLAKTINAKINLIPLNSIEENSSTPTKSDLNKFVSTLQKNGALVTIRNSRGDEIAAACGQLKNQIENQQKSSVETAQKEN